MRHSVLETDFREDLKKFDVPTLVIHGDDDQIGAEQHFRRKSAKLVKGRTLKVYKGAPHGLMSTNRAQFNADLLEFGKGIDESGRNGNPARSTESGRARSGRRREAESEARGKREPNKNSGPAIVGGGGAINAPSINNRLP